MSEEKVYPAIYEAKNGDVFMCANKSNQYSMGVGVWINGEYEDEHKTDKNITRECLANTYGEVVSPEHAEFIVELCRVNSIPIIDRPNISNPNHFIISRAGLGFYNCTRVSSTHLRQITIPLPPKQIQIATPEEEFEMTQIEKNNGDNLMFGGADKCKEWPCVGDKVTFNDKLEHYKEFKQSYCDEVSTVIARFKSDEGEFIVVHRKFCAVMAVRVDLLIRDGVIQKPKTPEEELRDWMHERIGYGIASGFDCEQITHDLLHHLNITKKPQ